MSKLYREGLCGMVKTISDTPVDGVHYFIINGHPRSGKDTFVDFCSEICPGRVLNLSTVDIVKQIASDCGWDGTKTAEARKFLSDLKDLLALAPWGNVSHLDIAHKIENFVSINAFRGVSANTLAVFIHSREPEDIAILKEKYNAKTILVQRDSEKNAQQSNHADAQVNDFDYDYYIANNGTLNDLKNIAKWFLISENLLFEYNYDII